MHPVRKDAIEVLLKTLSEVRLKNFIRAKRIISSVGENGIELIKDNEFYNGQLK